MEGGGSGPTPVTGGRTPAFSGPKATGQPLQIKERELMEGPHCTGGIERPADNTGIGKWILSERPASPREGQSLAAGQAWVQILTCNPECLV